MELKINNFGPIREFSFDFEKDFHLIVGKNNIGKSYAITVAYLLLKSVIASSGSLRFSSWIFRDEDISGKVFDKKIKALDKNRDVDVTQEFNSLLSELLTESFVSSFQEAIKGTFNSLDSVKNRLSGSDFSIELKASDTSILLSAEKEVIHIKELHIGKSVCLRKIKQRRKPKVSDSEIIIYYSTDHKEIDKGYMFRLLIEFYVNLLTELKGGVKSIHYLPASRSGLYQALGAFSQIIAELSKRRSFVSNKIELPGISEPLSDYFLALSEINNRKRTYINKPTNKIANKIETDILKGTVEFDSKTKKLMYTPNDTNLRLDLSSTSSMVSELSPIVSYLRYILTKPKENDDFRFLLGNEKEKKKEKSLIFIEEPEAHLHPEVQVKLIEYFAELVGADVKLILTSHSNYIFNKANNLIMEEKLNFSKINASILRSTVKGSVASKLDYDELGIEDENFIDTSEKLYEEKINLVNKINCDV